MARTAWEKKKPSPSHLPWLWLLLCVVFGLVVRSDFLFGFVFCLVSRILQVLGSV